MAKILNIPKIQKDIGKKHVAFLDKIGGALLKVSADHELNIARLSSKISAILDCLIEAKVIDKFIPCEDSSFRSFHLVKNGLKKSVYVLTDGSDIIFEEFNIFIKYGLHDAAFESMKVENIDNYNWEKFSMDLLDYIHKVIYERKAAIETKFFKPEAGE